MSAERALGIPDTTIETGKVATRLVLWLLLTLAFSFWAPTPGAMKVYNTIGPLHYAVFLLAPLGACMSARDRAPLWFFIVYGSLCTLDFDFRLGHRWEALVFVGRRTTPFAVDLACLCGCSLVAGLMCRFVAGLRWRIDEARARRLGICVRCSYNLTGNVSGICPECGAPI